MGCFNVSCSLSRLPITAGTQIRAFLLARPHSFPHSLPRIPASTPSVHYFPLTTGVVGTYDDQGRIENCMASPLFDRAAQHFMPGYDGDAAKLINNALYGRPLEIMMPYLDETVPCSVSATFIREDIHQILCGMSEFPGQAGDYTWSRAGTRRQLEAIQKKLPDPAMLIPDKGIDARYMVGRRIGLDAPKLDMAFRGQRDNMLMHEALAPYANDLLEKLGKGALDEDTLMFGMEIVQHIHVHQMMHVLSMTWQPHGCMIGQEHQFGLQKSFSNAVSAICTREAATQAIPAVVPVLRQP